MRQIEKMVQEICVLHHWTLKMLADGWVLCVEGQWIYGYHFGLNNAAADRLCDDKVATYDVLIRANIPAVEHKFLTEENLNLSMLEKRLLTGSLVIKPNDGTGGCNVVCVTTVDKLQQELKRLFISSDRLAVSPFIDIRTEYRVVVLDGEVELFYAKHLMNANEWKFNLGQGASAEVLTINKKFETLALSAVTALNVRFASVDIVELTDGNCKILEVNSGVMMEYFSKSSDENYMRARSIYEKALKKAIEYI